MVNTYLILTKPGIIMGNLITFAGGFFLAAKGVINFQLFLIAFIGLAFIMASGCVFNNYIDRQIDKKMGRTKNRALVIGLISGCNALLFATLLGVIGNLLLFTYTNLLTAFVADSGLFVYVILYSLWKSRTIYATAIGSIAGAVPPVVGYCAVSNQLDLGALILFAMLVLWQMPHFFSIALYHFDDYKAAGVPVLPVMRGVLRTKIHMIVYIVCFVVTASLLTYFHYTGYLYLSVVVCMGLAWLGLCVKGFFVEDADDQLWGRHMFILSLVLITAICLVIPFDV